MRVLLISSLSLATLVLGCGRDKKSQDGLPPATEWKADQSGAMVQMGKDLPPPAPPPGMVPQQGMGPSMGGGGGDRPAMPDDDVHRNLGQGQGGAEQGGGVDVSQLGLPPPDPNRPIDPNRFVKGVLKVHEKAKGRTKAGTPIFVVVKRADASGQPIGTPLAVQKLMWSGADLTFELTEADAMIGGTELTGDVVVTARYDQDGDAMSKEAGDIVGQTRVKLPADNVQIYLDTIL